MKTTCIVASCIGPFRYVMWVLMFDQIEDRPKFTREMMSVMA